MEYWKQILEVVCKRPHRLLVSFFWLIQGKKVRARNRLGLLETNTHLRYEVWQKITEEKENHSIVSGTILGAISFLVCFDDQEFSFSRKLSLTSLGKQSYKNWTLHDISGPIDSVKLTRFDYLVWLRQGDILPPNALHDLVQAIEGNPGVGIVYSDHDYLSAKGKREYPYFKGAWNYVLLQSSDYICGLCAIRTDLLTSLKGKKDVFSWKGRYQALLELGAEEGVSALHVPKILYHCRKNASFYPGVELLSTKDKKQGKSVSSSNAKIDRDSGVEIARLGIRSVSLSDPKVTIIIPTRDRLALLKPCVTSILKKTTYTNSEILIIDNNSERVETLEYLEAVSKDSRINIVAYPGEFNYAAANNLGVEYADGEIVCLLNSDTEVIEPSWLEYMVAWAASSNVGAVGAKLLYRDNRIQHAGIVIGLGGLAGHGHRFLQNNKPGYFYRAHLPQQVSAVTGACLMVAREKYLKVGGMDSENFAVAFNDVDFCLKLNAAGYDNVYEPRALLYHYESRSRGKDLKGVKRERYMRECIALRKRWSTESIVDRFYSPHLAPDREDFAIRTTKN